MASKEIFLDTKQTCFFCLDQQVEKEIRKICLKDMCRYLNFNPCSILVKHLEEQKKCVQGDKWDFSVLLCSSCASLTEKLSMQVRRMETAKKSASEYLQRILGKTENGDNHNLSEGTSVLSIIDYETHIENVFETSMVGQLRNEAKEKCRTMLLEPLDTTTVEFHPLQQPSRGSGTTLAYQEKQDNVTTTVAVAANHNALDNSLEGSEGENSANRDESEKLSLHCENSLKGFISTICTQNSRKFGSHCFQCVRCSRLNDRNGHKRHIVMLHPDQFFLTIKLPRTSDMDFKKYCINVLSEKTCRVPGNLRGNQMSCPSCTWKGKLYELKCHLITNHYNEVEKEILNYQYEQSATKAGALKKITKRKFICSGCGSCFRLKMQYLRHYQKSCYYTRKKAGTRQTVHSLTSSNHLLSAEAMSKYSVQVFKPCGQARNLCKKDDRYRCKLCNTCERVYNKCMLQLHLVNVHPEKLFAEQRFQKLPEDVFRDICKQAMCLDSGAILQKSTKSMNVQNKSVSCSECSFTCRDTYNLSYHIVVEHQHYFKEKILTIQQAEYNRLNIEALDPNVGNATDECRKRDDVPKEKKLNHAEGMDSRKKGPTSVVTQNRSELFKILHQRWRLKKSKLADNLENISKEKPMEVISNATEQ